MAIYQSISIAEGSSIEATADLQLGCGHEPIAPILSSELCPERVGPPAQTPQNFTSDSPMASGEVPKSDEYFQNFTMQLSASVDVAIDGYVLGSIVRILTPILVLNGKISTDGRGCAGGQDNDGPGSGGSTTLASAGGGGYGGVGGNGTVNGTAYGAETLVLRVLD